MGGVNIVAIRIVSHKSIGHCAGKGQRCGISESIFIGVGVPGQNIKGGIFIADEVLAKHDETYMPPEVAEALKKSGQWQGQDKK